MGRLLWLGLAVAMTAAAAPVPILFDTDMDTDCDDAGALAMLHVLADRGEATILATVVSSRFRWSVPCVAAINRYYGRPDLPIGAPKSEGADTGRRGSRYARQISEAFPTKFKDNDDAPAATEVYRRIMAGQPDGSVVIVTVGYLTNLRDLLATQPDRWSSLNGPDLIRRKVKQWVCMGGRYPRHLDPGVFGNFKPDPAAAETAVRDWPGPIMFTGLGDDIHTGVRLRTTATNNPARRAYELYLGGHPTRPSWDPIAVLYAVRSGAEFWEVRTSGHNHLFANGTNEWRDGPATNHRLLLLQPGMNDRVRDAMEDLMAQPPKVAGRFR